MSWFMTPCVRRKGHGLNAAATACRHCGKTYVRDDEDAAVLPLGAPMETRGLKLRRKLIARDGPFCWWCGGRITEAWSTVDHIVPISLGGTDGQHNLVVACRPCNSLKGNMHPLVWIAVLVDP